MCGGEGMTERSSENESGTDITWSRFWKSPSFLSTFLFSQIYIIYKELAPSFGKK